MVILAYWVISDTLDPISAPEFLFEGRFGKTKAA